MINGAGSEYNTINATSSSLSYPKIPVTIALTATKSTAMIARRVTTVISTFFINSRFIFNSYPTTRSTIALVGAAIILMTEVTIPPTLLFKTSFPIPVAPDNTKQHAPETFIGKHIAQEISGGDFLSIRHF